MVEEATEDLIEEIELEDDAHLLLEDVSRILFSKSKRTIKPRSSYLRRAGVLLNLKALEIIGATPIERDYLKTLLYLGDVLLPVFGGTSFQGYAFKRNAQPHQVDWMWDLDRLIGMGLVSIEKKAHKEFVGLTSEGENTAKKIINYRKADAKNLQSLMEISMAFTRVSPDFRDLISRKDENFIEVHVDENEVFDYGAWAGVNHSANFVEELAKLAPFPEPIKNRVSTFMYIKLIEEKTALEAAG